MAEVASFGNIVSSLVALRQTYHEQLKSLPQYEAYLFVHASTEKAAGALQAGAETPSSIAAEVIDSLQFARSRFEQHLNGAPEYRTLLAIDKLIKEVSIDLGAAASEEAPASIMPEAVISEPAPAAPDELDAAAPDHEDDGIMSVAPDLEDELEPDPVVATVEAIETEAIARPPVESPITPPRVTIDLDEALADDDDIVSVRRPHEDSAIEGGDDDLLEMTRRDTPKPATASAGAKEEAA